MPALSEDNKNKLFEIGAAIFISVAIYLISHITPFQRLELFTLDVLFNLRPPIATNPDVATIDIDSGTLLGEGRWQDWTRIKHARIIDIVRQGQGAMLGFDIFFAEESQEAFTPEEINAEILRRSQGTLDIEELVAGFPDFDEELAEAAMNAGTVYWAMAFNLAEKGDTRDAKEPETSGSSDQAWKNLEYLVGKEKFHLRIEKARVETILRAKAPEAIPFPRLVDAARGVGFIQIVPEADGVVRKYPTFIRCDYPPGEDTDYTYLFPSIGLAVACDYLGVPVANLKLEPGKYLDIPDASRGDGSIMNIRIPINEKGEMIINWAGDYNDAFRHFPYSLLALLDERRTFSEIKSFISRLEPSILESQSRLLAAVADAYPEVHDYADYISAIRNADVLEALVVEDGIQEFEPSIFTELAGYPPEEDPQFYEKLKDMFEEIQLNQAVVNILSEDPLLSLSKIAERLDVSATDIKNAVADIKPIIDRGGVTPADRPLYFLSPAVMNDRPISFADLRGGVFFYGLTATGTHDFNPMPFNARYPMVGSLANVFNTIVTGQFIAPMPARWRLPLYLALGLLVGYILSTRTTIRGSFFTILLLFAYLLLAYELFAARGIWIDVVGPAAIVVLSDVVIVWYKFNAAEKKRKFIRSAFEQYMNPAVVEQIAKNPEMLELGGKEMVLTAFFSDVAGFTTISEKLTPHELVELLNEYLTAMTDIVLDHLGLLDKYEGDAIMAVFGAPIHSPDHAKEACYTALEMQSKLCELREKWKAEGKPELTARIGLNSGPMIVGNMGSRKRFDYTVMGDAVNLASRLEGVNKQYSTDIMISEFTLEQCKADIVVREIDLIRVKGKAEPVRIYEVLGRSDGALPDDMKVVTDKYSAGLEAYRLRKWHDGIKAFQQALEVKPDDGPSLTYLKRCEGYSTAPPPDDWDGVYVMTTK